MVRTIGLGFIGIVLLAVCVVILMPAVEPVTVDFENYYADAKPGELFTAEYNRMMQASMFVDVGTTYSHAEQKHPGVNECMQGSDVIQVWENPFSQHCAEIYKVDDHNFVVRIIAKINGKFEEITGIAQEVEGLWEIEEYMINGSYMQIWGAP